MAGGRPLWPWLRRWFGDRAERAAARQLRRRGYRILSRNLLIAGVELDIVALDRRTVVFVEVRSTESADVDQIAATVDARKQTRITRGATAFLRKHHLLDRSARFDVVVVRWPRDRREPEVTHFLDAFEAAGRE